MKNKPSRNITMMLTLIVLSYVAHYFLLRDNFLHISISSIISHSHNLEIKKHLLVLGLLPFYIATMVFGTALLGIYLGAMLHTWLDKLKKRFLAGSKILA